MIDDVQALQGALETLHATIWAYGEIGAGVSDQHLDSVSAADDGYRAQRDALEEIIRGLGQEPVPAQAGYALPVQPSDDASALALAADLDDAMAAQWRHCTGKVGTLPVRTFCVDALIASTSAALRWRRAAQVAPVVVPAFPGLG